PAWMPPASKTMYTCPMHPEVVQDHPGTCPKCGMALEPITAAADDEEDSSELDDMSRRFWISLVFTLPLVVLAMGHVVGWTFESLFSARTGAWIQLVLATPVVLWGGWPFFERGARSLRTMNLDMFTLIALGTGVAWAYSVVA